MMKILLLPLNDNIMVIRIR